MKVVNFNCSRYSKSEFTFQYHCAEKRIELNPLLMTEQQKKKFAKTNYVLFYNGEKVWLLNPNEPKKYRHLIGEKVLVKMTDETRKVRIQGVTIFDGITFHGIKDPKFISYED